MGSVNAHRQNFGRSLEYHNLQPLKSTCHSARKSTQTCPNDDDLESLRHCMSASTELEPWSAVYKADQERRLSPVSSLPTLHTQLRFHARGSFS
jgi:hypothetical protein